MRHRSQAPTRPARAFALLITALRLIRPLNLLIVAATFLIVYHGLVLPALALSGYSGTLSVPGQASLVLSLLALTGAGYVINDIVDQPADRVNKSRRSLVGSRITVRQAERYYVVLHLLAGFSGLLAAGLADRWEDLWLLVLVGIGLHGYSVRWKGSGLPANVLISLCCAGVVALPVFAELDRWRSMMANPTEASLRLGTLLWAYTFFAFQTTLIRELVKDLQDTKGDRMQGIRTLPLRIGETRTIRFILALVGMLAAGLVFFAWHLDTGRLENLLGILLIGLPLGFAGLELSRSNTAARYGTASACLKITMAGGLILLIILLGTDGQ